MLALACLAHWYDSLLYVAPIGIVGGGLWFAGKRTGPGDGEVDEWDVADGFAADPASSEPLAH